MFGTGSFEQLNEQEQLLAATVSAAETALMVATSMDVEGVSPDVLRAATLRIERTRRHLDAAVGHALIELDDHDTTECADGLRTSRWLAAQAGLPSGTARQRLAVARTLANLAPGVAAALTDGTIGFDHARVIAEALNERNIDQISPFLDQIISTADQTVFHRWRRDTQAFAAMLDPDGGHDPADDIARNTLRLSPSDDFTMVRGELTGDNAATVVAAVEHVADELFRQWSRDVTGNPELQMPSRPMLLAMALVELCRRGQSVDLGSSRPPKVEVTLVMHEDRPESLYDPTGSPLPAATIPAFLCDPEFHAAMLDSLGLPVVMGRATQRPTPAQRRALSLRDGGCTFPGCSCPVSWTDAHHTIEWARDGPTDVPLIALLCRRHHRVAHRAGWSVTLTDDGWTHWTTPSGRTFYGQRHGRKRAGPAPPGA